MEFLSRALEWVRAVLFGPRTPGRHRRTPAPRAVFPMPSRQPSPEVWGARLTSARSHHRVRQAPPPCEDMGVLVRPYVTRLGEGVYAGAQAGPWEDTR
ncbi:hypothetical protein GCM10010383_06320 [Streptomyces lomondensis]|uniref:Uncharacterized protein n=1 Tax=Streptomyces lomondensis TaxID=68229 RepID=A0ABQ2WV96_9ACTN|nr:hypothetical protein GCM10010383_06320 [Streptomyces lomondensis]